MPLTPDIRISRKTIFLVVSGLATITFLVYWRVLDAGFVNYDDPTYVWVNPEVAKGLTLESVAYAFSTFDLGNWIPVTWLSWELDAALFGVDPHAFHRTNVVLHLVNVLLVAVAFWLMTGQAWPALMTAVCFAVHPLHVESVAWISERKDVLSTTFLLLTLIAYRYYAVAPSVRGYMIVIVMMMIGLLAKPMLVSLPILLLLCDAWPLMRIKEFAPESHYATRSIVNLIYEKIPLFLLAFADALITILAQSFTETVSSLERVPFVYRLGNSLASYGWYLWKTIAPTDLCVLYPHPQHNLSWIWVAVSLGILVIITVGAIHKPSTHGHRVFGWLWFVISLLPVIGIIQVGKQAYADRYVYVPHIGLFTMLSFELWNWAKQKAFRLKIASAGLLFVCMVWSVITIDQTGVWRDSETLWNRVLRLYPDSEVAHHQLGYILMGKGQFAEAEKHYQQGLTELTDHRTVFCLGRIRETAEDWAAAEEYYRWALRIRPTYQPAKSRLADLARNHPSVVSSMEGDRPAKKIMQQGLAAARRGDMDEAIRLFRSGLEIDSQYADLHNNLALALSAVKSIAEAESELRLAVELSPENADFRVNLAVLLEGNGKSNEALQQYGEAIRLRPHDAEAKRQLRRLEERLGHSPARTTSP